MKLEMSLKKNVVGGLKFWKYFRTRFAGTRPPRLLVSRLVPWSQRQKSLVILMGHQKMPKIWHVLPALNVFSSRGIAGCWRQMLRRLCVGAGGVVASSPSGVSEILPHLAIYRRRHLRERLG